MAEFKYKGRNAQGNVVRNQITASNESDVAKVLLGKGITPLDIIPIKTKDTNKLKSSGSLLSADILGGRAKLTDIMMFSRQMAALTKAGMPIGTSLVRLAETTSSKPLKKALMGISQDVSGGKTLSLSIAQYPKVFSPIFINMVNTGEHTGNLSETFDHLTSYLELEASVRKRIKAIMRYPVIVLTAIMVAMTVINIMVIPAFAKMFKRFGENLPLPTRVLLKTSDAFIHYWPHMLIVAVFLFIFTHFYAKTDKGKYAWDHVKVRIPLFGNVIMEVLLMRFSSLFAMIFRSGVPLIKGMSLVANGVGNFYVKKAILNIRDAVEGGDTLFHASINSKLFPPLVTQMISVGEESGTLDTMLEQVAEYYEREVDYKIKQLGDMMEPILLVIIAAMVLILALGVFLPMWDMATFSR